MNNISVSGGILMQIKLSKRLTKIIEMITLGSTVADIGTDHGYLPVHLVINGISPRVIATDVNEQPLASAAKLVTFLVLEKKIDLRLGDGLSILVPGEVETIVIAGIGASNELKILEESPQILNSTNRLILQPMRGTPKIRAWLVKHGWRIIDEELVLEDHIFYEIIAAEKGNSVLSIDEVENGPMLLKKKHPLLKEFIKEKIETLELIDKSLEKSTNLNTKGQKQDIIEQINDLKRVITCL